MSSGGYLIKDNVLYSCTNTVLLYNLRRNTSCQMIITKKNILTMYTYLTIYIYIYKYMWVMRMHTILLHIKCDNKTIRTRTRLSAPPHARYTRRMTSCWVRLGFSTLIEICHFQRVTLTYICMQIRSKDIEVIIFYKCIA